MVYEELEAGLEVATRVLRRFGVGPDEVQRFVDEALESTGHTQLRGDLESVLAEAEERLTSDDADLAGHEGSPQ